LSPLKKKPFPPPPAAGPGARPRPPDAIRTGLRATDIGARWGGDEFAIVAPNTSEASAQALAERVRLLAAERASEWRGTASLGVATVDPVNGGAAFEVDELIQTVDAALYEAKQCGRNCVVSRALARPVRGAGLTSATQIRSDGHFVKPRHVEPHASYRSDGAA
jgi:hypothetical protein